MPARLATLSLLLLLSASSPAARLWANDAVTPGRVIEETPTLECLGVRWLVAGDDNRNARATVEYRRWATSDWVRGPDLFRVESAGMRPDVRPPAGQSVLAGSIFGLREDTEYEVRLRLEDPDGGGAERRLRMKTWKEPQLPPGMREVRVEPGRLREALAKALPGDKLVLSPGVYPGSFTPPSGTPERPVAIVGPASGEAVLDGQGKDVVLSAPGLHDVFFEGLSIRNARYGIAVNEGARLTVRRCKIDDVDYGLAATRNGQRQQHVFIADCTLRGRSTWPRTQGIEGRRGIQLGGTGHVVCHNRISHFADGIDTFPAYPCAAIDFYRNDISECTDDGIEMDYSDCNTRCFENRLTNVFQGISVQPVHGGPVYVLRNALYNVEKETFKLHNSPSGALFYHNTSVKAGMPLVLMTNEPVSNCRSRNNLFVGARDSYAFECLPPMRDCDFDVDGFAGSWKLFLKWNGTRYASLEEAVAKKAPAYRRAVLLKPEGLFASGLQTPADAKRQLDPAAADLRLKPDCGAVDAGEPVPGINDGFRGRAPDLGAHELGAELPHYGPRPVAAPPSK